MSSPQPDVTSLARKWRLDIDTLNSSAAPNWIQVRGTNEWTPSPQKATIEDDNAYEENGWLGKTKTALEWSHELTLVRRRNPTTGAYDPGQEALRSRSQLFGASGMAHVRWYPRDVTDPEAFEGWAEVEWAPAGGATTDLEKITVTLHGKGERILIANPA